MLQQRLGELLVQSGATSTPTAEAAALESQHTASLIGEVLRERYGVTERDVYDALARQRGLPFAEAEELFQLADPGLAEQISGRFRDFHRVIPIRRDGDTLLAATCDPHAHLPELASALEAHRLDLRLVTPTDYYRLRAALLLGNLGEGGPAPSALWQRAVAPVSESLDASMVQLFDALLLDAVAERASDLHFEVFGDRPRIRIRADGDLHEVGHYRLTPAQFVSVVNVAKVRARMDIAERRAPQGGRFSAAVRDQGFDVRAQTQPSLHGEHLVLRLLPQERVPLGIEDLGFSASLSAAYRRLLVSPAGLVLVVGPTGSGKSTTLYAGLQILAADLSRKVISVEDPIEYAIDGVQQCQVLPEVGFTFATAMRAFVREDPDVILVGEIRDSETALEALRASQTGHLVLSTLHCNDSVDAVQRLLDLGMHPNSIGSELQAVIAQRLAKRICASCRVETDPDPVLAAEVFPSGLPPGFRTFEGRGCPRCSGRGTYGRVAVAEFLTAAPELRIGIAHQLPLDELRAVARRTGVTTLRDAALDLVREGVIAFSELRDMIAPDLLAGAPEPPAPLRAGPPRRRVALA